MKGEMGSSPARRLMGSPDLYGHHKREPEQSINFVTCHDGFTLNDLVSYNQKHNEANGEETGTAATKSELELRIEGHCRPGRRATAQPPGQKLPNAGLLSAGGAILLMGDEVRRTQRGNNNAYCQDNEISWFDWRGPAQHADIHRFARLLLMLRSRRDLARVGKNMTLNQILHHARITWHGIKLDQPDWSDDSHSLAVMCLTLDGWFLYSAPSSTPTGSR